ncbi:MAG: divalent-cation tolerance protein CutA [Chromatiales bacterium]|jgi:periplasmic divalent cation tolerance protein|nr:divalent-cation tolerance protein CutA [Chromatiales bacterium]
MTAASDCRLVLTTCPDDRVARLLARALIEAELGACVNIVPGLTSIYRWQGVVEEGSEVLLLIKTLAVRYEALESFIRERHPYQLAEIIAVDLSAGLPAYLAWIGESVRAES